MINFDCKIDWNLNSDDILRKFNLEPHGRVQTAIDNAVMRYAEPYWAHDTGDLSTSCYGATDAGSGVITYPGPYAHYMYTGIVYGPNIWNEDGHIENAPQPYFSPPGKKKHPTTREIKYKKDKSKDAGKDPINRMKAHHMEDILEEARRIVRDEQR